MDSKKLKKGNRQLDMLFCSDITKNIESDFRNIGAGKWLISEITINGNQYYLTDRARTSFRDLFQVIIESIEFANVTNNDVFRELRKIYAEFLGQSTKPTIEEMVERLHISLDLLKKKLNFLIPVEGISIKEGCDFRIGEISFQEQNSEFLEQFNLKEGFFKKSLFRNYENHKYWAEVSASGSRKYAEKQIVPKIEHHLSIFIIYLTACTPQYFTNTRIRMLLNNMEGYSTRVQLSWEDGHPETISCERSLGMFSIVNIDESMIIGLKNSYFHIFLPNIVEKQDKSEIEAALCRSLYWFGEAYKEPVQGMKFLKLWSCIECFFSIDREEITSANSVGIATVLKTVDSISQHPNRKDTKYSDYERKAKKFYKLRSEITHSALYSHIQDGDVEDLAEWVINVVYIMIYFVEEKLTKLHEVKIRIQKKATELTALEVD